MIYQDWTGVVGNSVLTVWDSVAAFIPQAVGAIVVFVVGMIVTGVLGSTVEKALEALKVDSLLDRTGLNREVGRLGIHLNVAKFFGKLTWWFFMVVTVVSVIEILLPGVSALRLVGDAVSYIPQVAGAVVIMLGAVVLANFVRQVVRTTASGAKLAGAGSAGTLAWWSVAIFGFMAALTQLGIAAGFLQTLFTGVVAAFALAAGLAFGLGGKDYAAHLLSKFREEVE